jgi:nucleoside-diphosphate-sugar epimerase
MAEIMALAYQRLAGVNAVICRPCAVYGRGGYVGGALQGSRLNEALLSAMHGPAGVPIPIEIPTAERVYVKDAAFAIREAIFVEKQTTQIYNVGSGEIITSAMLAAAINAAVPGARAVAGEVSMAGVRPLDSTLARQELKYEPQWPLARAIPDYVAELR